MDRSAFLENSMIVAAHPDDELLWFNAILAQVDRVVVVFEDFWAKPEIGAARRAALADYPRPIESLGLAESGAYGCANWSVPAVSEHGLAFTTEARRRELTRLTRRSLPRVGPLAAGPVAETSVAQLYRDNFAALLAALRPRLRPGMNVFTHNPWGEYGHEEHVQLFRALDRLRSEIGFTLWMSNYCTERALPLAMRYFDAAPGRYIRLPCDPAFAERAADVYKRHGCWTWADDWAWFEEECYREAPHGPGDVRPHAHLFPLNLFVIDGVQSRNWLPMAVSLSAAGTALGLTLSETI